MWENCIQAFQESHIDTWVSSFMEEVRRLSSTGVYASLAKVTLPVLEVLREAR